MRIIKSDSDRHQASWYAQAPAGLIPSGLELTGTLLSYDFVQGQHPTDWQAVHRAASGFWAMPGPTLPIDPERYIDYCCADHPVLAREIRVAVLTPVALCHGDMTLANVIQDRTGRLTFIDPGYDRGLPCVELDEAKLLQSLDGFDVVYRGWQQPQAWPKMPTRRIHWALLATHYLRLLKHVEHRPSRDFAQQRIKEICELLS